MGQDIFTYLENNSERFEQRGIYEENYDKFSEETLKWLAMVDILESSNYIAELDYKAELVDFIQSLNNLLHKKKLNKLKINRNDINEDYVSKMSKQVDMLWSNKGYCIGIIDIESDSCIIFPCKNSDIMKLAALGNKYRYTICKASNR